LRLPVCDDDGEREFSKSLPQERSKLKVRNFVFGVRIVEKWELCQSVKLLTVGIYDCTALSNCMRCIFD